MRPVVSLALAALVFLAATGPSAAPPAPAREYCAVKSPQTVLSCLETAYEKCDLALYSALLADDYHFVFGKARWDRATDVAQAEKLFGKTPKLEMSLHGTVRPAPGPDRDTWIISNLTITLSVAVDGRKEPFQVTNDNTFRVRLEKDPAPHYVIYEWTQPDKS